MSTENDGDLVSAYPENLSTQIGPDSWLHIQRKISEEVTQSEGNWELLVATSDVKSELFLMTLSNGSQMLHFQFGEEGYLQISVADFLLIYRLFNMTWYSRLLSQLDVCLNVQCPNLPYGGHVRKEDCMETTPYQKAMMNDYQTQMRELQRQEKLRLASIGGENSNQPLAGNESPSPNTD